MADLQEAFFLLREAIVPYAERLVVRRDDDQEFYADAPHTMPNGKPLFFGAVMLRKTGVSLHLMPLYVEPRLLADSAPGLSKRLSGKSCLRFRSLSSAELEDVRKLIEACFRSYEGKGLV